MKGMKMKCRTCNRGPRAGFTFIEIMLVIAMIAILATVVAVTTGDKQDKAKVSAAKQTIAALSTGADLYQLDVGDFPRSLDELINDPGKKNWDGPYLKKLKEIPDDPWGQPYAYKVEGKGFSLVSAGKDGQVGTEDDVD